MENAGILTCHGGHIVQSNASKPPRFIMHESDSDSFIGNLNLGNLN